MRTKLLIKSFDKQFFVVMQRDATINLMQHTAPNHRALYGIYGARALSFTGLFMVHLFLAIFLYEFFGDNLFAPILYFFLMHLFYLLLAPVGGILLRHVGGRTMLLISLLIGTLFMGSLHILSTSSAESPFLLLWLFLIGTTSVLYRIFYWIPFHIDFAKFTDRTKRGVQTGILFAIITLLGIAAPVLGGYLTETYGYDQLLVVAIGVFLLAAVPMLLIPNQTEQYDWSYRESLRRLFMPEHRHIVLVSAVTGAENMLGVVVWPLFIFFILEGDYFDVGLLSGVVVAVTALLQIFIGRYMDKVPKDKVFQAGSLLAAGGWAIKILVATAFQVFLVGIYHNLARSFLKTSYNAFFYEVAADQGHYVDEFTILREMAIQLGKSIALIVVAIIVAIASLQWAFLVGVAAALFLNTLLSRGRQHAIARVV